MSPKEQAMKLVDIFSKAEGDDFDFIGEPGDATMCWRMSRSLAKQCALIAVDEIMKVEQAVKMNFWKAVKKEISKL